MMRAWMGGPLRLKNRRDDLSEESTDSSKPLKRVPINEYFATRLIQQ